MPEAPTPTICIIYAPLHAGQIVRFQEAIPDQGGIPGVQADTDYIVAEAYHTHGEQTTELLPPPHDVEATVVFFIQHFTLENHPRSARFSVRQLKNPDTVQMPVSDFLAFLRSAVAWQQSRP